MGIHAGNRSRPAYSGQARFEFPFEVKNLFKARPPLPYARPVRVRRRSRLHPMSGIASFTAHFESREEYLAREKTAAAALAVTPARKREIARVEAAERVTQRVALMAAGWKCADQRDAAETTGDPFCTIIVYRLWKGTGVSALRADFGTFGRVVRVALPKDRRGLPRGYAFVEFADERDLKAAISGSRGRLIDGRRVHVDVERGRTVRGFLPNRLDGPFNSAAAAARKILGGKSSIAEEARLRLAESEAKLVIPVYIPPVPPKPTSPSDRDLGYGPPDRDFRRGGGRGFAGGGFRGGDRRVFRGDGDGDRGGYGDRRGHGGDRGGFEGSGRREYLGGDRGPGGFRGRGRGMEPRGLGRGGFRGSGHF